MVDGAVDRLAREPRLGEPGHPGDGEDGGPPVLPGDQHLIAASQRAEAVEDRRGAVPGHVPGDDGRPERAGCRPAREPASAAGSSGTSISPSVVEPELDQPSIGRRSWGWTPPPGPTPAAPDPVIRSRTSGSVPDRLAVDLRAVGVGRARGASTVRSARSGAPARAGVRRGRPGQGRPDQQRRPAGPARRRSPARTGRLGGRSARTPLDPARATARHRSPAVGARGRRQSATPSRQQQEQRPRRREGRVQAQPPEHRRSRPRRAPDPLRRPPGRRRR